MKRIIIIGSPGAGKSFLARQVSVLTGIKLHHLDNIYWREDKTHIEHDELVYKLEEIFKEESFIIDGNYNNTMDLRIRAADTIVYLDFDVEDCVAGIKGRVGSKRDDIPWIEETLDPEFLQFVKDFPFKSKPKIMKLINETAGKNIITLHNREEVNNFVKSLFPESVRKFADEEGFEIITRDHLSGDIVYGFGDKYILKVSSKESRLKREYDVNEYMKDRAPVSQNVVYEKCGNVEFYLKTCVPGIPLSYEQYISNPKILIDILAEAMEMVHSIDVSECEIKNYDSEEFTCFVHGDFCLPNILGTGNTVSGIIDTEAGGAGDPWVDYAWCIWSLEFNLHTKKYTKMLLDKLGIEFDAAKYEKFIGNPYQYDCL